MRIKRGFSDGRFGYFVRDFIKVFEIVILVTAAAIIGRC